MAPRISDLRMRRAAVADEMRQLVETAENANRDLDENEVRRFDELQNETRSLDGRISRAETARETQLAAAGTGGAAGETRAARGGVRNGEDGSGRELARLHTDYSLTRYLASFLPGSNVAATAERELATELRSREPDRKWKGEAIIPGSIFHAPRHSLPGMETRAVIPTTFATTNSGAIVPEAYLGNEYIDLVAAQLVSATLGVRVINDLTGAGSFVIPKQLTGSAAGWVPENGEVPEGGATWGTVTLNPKTCGVFTTLSRRLLLSSTPRIDALVRSDLARAMAEAFDNALLYGNPAANEPKGLLRYAGSDGLNVVSFGAAGGPLTLANVLSMYAAPKRRNFVGRNMAWVGSSRITERALQTLMFTGDAAGGPLMQFAPDGELRLMGKRYVESELNALLNHTEGASADLAALIFGDWSEAIIGYATSVEAIIDPFTLARTGAVRIVLLRDGDVAFRNLGAFALGRVDVTP